MSRQIYVADFETTTDPDDCRVWAYGICTLYAVTDFSYGNSIEGFIDSMNREDCIVYFHNLKFDGAFIIDWLFRHGYRHTTKTPKAGQFSTLISKLGQFYSMHVTWWNGHTMELRDSLKKLPMTVKRIGESFKLEESKGELDYRAYRAPGHELTAEEIEYIRRDVQIVARALKIQLDNSQGKLTIGADALAEFKELTGAKQFKKLFPILHVDIDAEIRSAYRGGWTYAKHDRRGIIQGGGFVYDVNSLYPSVMYDRVLPYGMPRAANVPARGTLWIASATFTATLRPGFLPCIQIKKSSHFLETEYVTEISEPVTLSFTSVDWSLWNEHYDINVLSWNGAYMFNGAAGMFHDYIDKWMKVKANNTGGLREIAKLHLNSLYGKFATNPDVTGKYPRFIDNRVKLTTGAEDTREPVYTAMGAFITAYAREVTIRAAQQNYDTFAYADTDSIHLITDTEPETLRIHPTDLGAWKREYSFTRAMYARAKAYSEQLPDGRYETHIAGLPRDIAEQMTIDDFQNGREFGGKLVPKYVPGGIVLTETVFTLKM